MWSTTSISKDKPTPEEVQGARDLASWRARSGTGEGDKGTRCDQNSCLSAPDEVCGLFEAADELRSAEGTTAEFKRMSLMAKVKDEKRWLAVRRTLEDQVIDEISHRSTFFGRIKIVSKLLRDSNTKSINIIATNGRKGKHSIDLSRRQNHRGILKKHFQTAICRIRYRAQRILRERYGAG